MGLVCCFSSTLMTAVTSASCHSCRSFKINISNNNNKLIFQISSLYFKYDWLHIGFPLSYKHQSFFCCGSNADSIVSISSSWYLVDKFSLIESLIFFYYILISWFCNYQEIPLIGGILVEWFPSFTTKYICGIIKWIEYFASSSITTNSVENGIRTPSNSVAHAACCYSVNHTSTLYLLPHLVTHELFNACHSESLLKGVSRSTRTSIVGWLELLSVLSFTPIGACVW